MNTISLDRTVCLRAETAADLMTGNPVSIRDNACIKEALVFLTEKGYSAVPVIDHAGRAVGVLSRYDIIVHDREAVDYLRQMPEFYARADLVTDEGERLTGFQVERTDRTTVGELMTPTIFAVRPDVAAMVVVEELLRLRVHRLFVIDEDEVLVGVISAMDILSHLRAEPR